MLSKKINKWSIATLAIFAALLIGGAVTGAGAFSVDVKNLYYSDPSPRVINNYDFSAGLVGTPIPPNNIGIPDSFVTKFGTDSGFMFGNVPDMGATTVTLKTTAQPPVCTVTTTEGGAVLQGASSGPPPQPATSWTYALALQNFSGVADAAKEYKFEIGTSAPMAAGPQPQIRGMWSASGTLILQARIYDDTGNGTILWSGNIIDPFTGLTLTAPAATTLELKIVNNGTSVVFSYRLNGGAETTLGTYTINGVIFNSLPARFPYLFLKEATPTPESPFQVSSQHWDDAQGNVYKAWPRVIDPLQALYSGVTMNSPGYITETPLAFNSAAGYWSLSGTLFSDDFNNNTVDTAKWSTLGTSVTESGGEFHVDTAATDRGGEALSRAIVINPYAPITVQRRAKVHYANTYFDGIFGLYFKDTPDFAPATTYTDGLGEHQHFNVNDNVMSVIVSHANYNIDGWGITGERSVNGFYLGRYNAHADTPSSPVVTPIWETWYDEKIIYNPVTGMAELYIDGVQKATYDVGALPATARYLKVFVQAWGWYTGHYNYSDDLTVSQPWTGGDVFLSNSTPPADPVVFNFTATKQGGGTETVQKTITGYVADFATNLLPAGDVTNATPTFSWISVSNAQFYGVEVSDANGNRVWNQYGIPSSTTSAVYNDDGTGPALVNGQTYHYLISAGINTDGQSNFSFAEGSFTYTGTASETISFSGWVKSIPNWPSTDGMAPIFGATVNALNETGPPPFAFNTTNTEGAFAITGIPASSTFRLVVPTPTSTTYVPVLSKWFNWTADIQALLPFALFTQAQYAAFGNTTGTSMILGRVASSTTFLSGATVTAREWTPGNPPVLGAEYQVTYTGGGAATGADGIYMVKNVPAGKQVQLVATLAGHTFEFNGAVIPVQMGSISEESFFGTPAGGGTISYSGILKKYSDDSAVSGALIEQVGNAAIYTTTQADGTFTLTGLPAGTEFTVKITGDTATYVPTYTRVIQDTADVTAARFYNLFTPSDLTNWGVTSGGAIRGRVINSDNTDAGYVSGATVTYSSSMGRNDYVVKYEDNSNHFTTGTGTAANGKYYVLNVAEGDTVTVSATHPNYTFAQSRKFITHAGAVSEAIIKGSRATGRVAIGGHIMNTATPPVGIKNATIEQVGATAPINATTSNEDGFFYLTVPATTTLQLKFSKPQATTPLAPTYSGNISFGAEFLGIDGYNLFPATKLGTGTGNWNLTPGAGIIRGRVRDQADIFIGGATVTAQGGSKSYAVCYDDDCTTTMTATDAATGRYVVKNVDAGDTVTVSAQMQGGSFNTLVFPTHGDSLHQGGITGTVAANNLLRNGSFSGNLNGWIVNPTVQTGTPPWTPLLQDGSGVNLHPSSYSFNGMILYQNLNLTGITGKTLSLSVKLTNVYTMSTGKTVAVWLSYVDGNGNLQRTRVLNPSNSAIATGTVVTGNFVVPTGAQKIVKLELVKEDYGEFHATDVVLWANGVTSNPTPVITNLSATSGAYGTSLTITGQNFGAAQGNGTVRVGGVPVNVVSWSDTAITVTVGSPARSGAVLVTAGQVESNLGNVFQVTSPYFAVDLVNACLKVLKGQKAEFILRSAFYNGFTTTGGIGLQLDAGLADKATFSPVPIRGDGGVVLSIDTTNLAAGDYTANVQTNDGGAVAFAATLNLQVVTVKDVQFFEWVGSPTVKTPVTSKNLTMQGMLGVQYEVIGSDDQIIENDASGVILRETPTGANAPILSVRKGSWGYYELYALWNGSTNLTAVALDGFTKNLPVTLTIPVTDPQMLSISLMPQSIPNTGTEAIEFNALGNTTLGWIGYESSGMMNFQTDFLDVLQRSGNGATASFHLTKTSSDLGTTVFYAQPYGSSAKVIVPLNIVNDPATGLLQCVIKSLDGSGFMDMFTLAFFDEAGVFQFDRNIYSMHMTGPVSVGNIPPGSYKILFIPANNSVRPQWYPNAATIAGAQTVGPFTAGGEWNSILYFFAMAQPAGSNVSLPTPASQTFTTRAAATGSVAVTATQGTGWAANSNDSWITITSGVTGIGNGTVGFAITVNTAADQRTGNITVGGQIFTVTQPGTSTVLKGDINGDGFVNLADAVLALKVVVGMDPTGIRANYATSGADVNGDGKVGAAEAIYILQYVAGLRQ